MIALCVRILLWGGWVSDSEEKNIQPLKSYQGEEREKEICDL